MEPCLGQAPVELDRGRRDPEDHGRLVDGQAAEVAHLDDPALPRCDLGERLERLVEGQIGLATIRDAQSLVKSQDDGTPAALGGALLARVAHQDAAYQGRRHGEELRPVLPTDALVLRQAHVDLVDDLGGLQGVSRALALEAALSEPPEVVVDQRHQTLESVEAPGAPFEEQPGDVFRGRGTVSRRSRGDGR
jgi:hypothetical protein